MSKVSLPNISEYSQEQINLAKQKLPAVKQYIEIISKINNDPSLSVYSQRHSAFVACALSNLYRTAREEDICHHWSSIADKNIQESWNKFSLSTLPIAVFAVGKLGAEELNLSSDVDLMIIAGDDAQFEKRQIANFINFLTQRTEYGFLHRVDLDLRPGGRLGPLVSTCSQFQDYYGNFGETWERLALIRLRPIIGNKSVIDEIENFVPKFCYRKHLDYTLLEDLKNLRKKIQHQYSTATDSSFNLKLGIGGIRDIELFIHALQVIHGGRLPLLRTRSTSLAIKNISNSGLLPIADADLLLNTYWHYRTLENALQAENDQQTHTTNQFNSELKRRTHTINSLVTSLLGEARSATDIPTNYEEQIVWLKNHGLNGERAESDWRSLIETKVLSKNKNLDEQQRLLFLQNFILELETISTNKELALSLLVDFVRSTRAKSTFFTLLNRNIHLIKDLAWLFSISPYLSQILISRPELLDSYLLKTQGQLSTDLSTALEELGDYKQLNELIISSRFLIEQDISGLVNNLTQTADHICSKILQISKIEIPESTLQILAMGKWAGNEIGLRSDLDFVFVADKTVTEFDHRVARRVVNRLTQKNKGGSLYNLDFRLRPSGNAGLIVVSKSQLEKYLITDSKPWERQAYLKSRPLEDNSFSARKIAIHKKLNSNDKAELISIKEKLSQQNMSSNLDIKYSSGGLVDVEFAYQWQALNSEVVLESANTEQAIEQLSKTFKSWKLCGGQLTSNYKFLRTIEQLHQLVTLTGDTKLDQESDAFCLVSKLTQLSPKELARKISSSLEENRKLIKDLDPLESNI